MSANTKPPVVTIMGHVDHGKTTLLDAIRHSKITESEHGGITQHTGAYQITHQGKKITFIDTPGHAVFSEMRARGAQITDLVILVVSATEGVKPQTKESLAHIREAKVPFLVCITKMDLPEADPMNVKAQLAENEVLVEGYGGQTVCLEVSAKNKQGLDQLLEMILLMAEVEGLAADDRADLEAVVVESKMDKRKGPLVTIIVKQGQLKKGDIVKAGGIQGKVRAISDATSQEISVLKPGDPGTVLGFSGLPKAGSQLTYQGNVLRATAEKKYRVPYMHITKKEQEAAKSEAKEVKSVKNKIKVMVKADTLGTLEAIVGNMPKELEIVLAEVGEVNESDVQLAYSSQAQIIAFNLKLNKNIQKMADLENIAIRHYDIIYKLFEDLEGKVLEWMEPAIREIVEGEGKVIAEFTIKKQHIAGCRITKGRVSRKNLIRVMRGDKLVADKLRMVSMQKEKQMVDEVLAGNEAGLVFRPDIDFTVGDDIISYNITK